MMIEQLPSAGYAARNGLNRAIVRREDPETHEHEMPETARDPLYLS
jgi:hypothetical protein